MVAKRAANRKAKQEEEEKPASEVGVSELVFDSEDGTDDGDDESEEYDSEVSAEEEEADTDNEIEHAVDDYVAGLRRMGPNSGSAADEVPEGESEEDLDPATDSSEDERPNRNTIGDVPLEWYKPEEHIGYDQEGNRLIKKGQKDTLDRMLARNDSTKFLRTVYDEYNDEEIVLSKEEMAMVNRIRKGQFPHAEVDPFPEENDWFSRDVQVMPVTGAPEPKSRFVKSKWEEKKVVKLVRALRRGWIKTAAERRREEREKEGFKLYQLWGDDGRAQAGRGSYIAPNRQPLPGHAESYNPPPEYLPTEEERAALELRAADSERPKLIPTAYGALRLVPAYANFIKERFERCLDLYLLPRGQRKRLVIADAKQLVPDLPQPRELRPFPDATGLRFEGHAGAITCVAPDPSGAWLATSSRDGTVRVWETRTARCAARFDLARVLEGETELEGRGAGCVAWCPDPQLRLLAVAVGSGVLLLPVRAAANEAQQLAMAAALAHAVAGGEADAAAKAEATEEGDAGVPTDEPQAARRSAWRRVASEADAPAHRAARDAVLIPHETRVTSVAWHGRGDYFASVAPLAVKGRSVQVHQLSRGRTQRPFRRGKGGRPVQLLFHPSKPVLFLAAQQQVRVYDLARQQLLRKLVCGSGVVTSMAVHESGDHLILGSEDTRLAWYDLDLSVRPFRALRFHTQAVRGVAFHAAHPLFASGSDDGSVHVFHGRVYSDLSTPPLIVPVKILRGAGSPVQSVAFHPTQPWVFAGGEDGVATLFINV